MMKQQLISKIEREQGNIVIDGKEFILIMKSEVI